MALIRTSGGTSVANPVELAFNAPTRAQAVIKKETLDNFKYIQLVASGSGYPSTWSTGLASAVRFYVDNDGSGSANSLTSTPVEISTLNINSYLFIDEQTTPRFIVKLSN